MSLYEKMYQVMCESEALKKEMEVGSGSYKYKGISEAEVLNTVKPLLRKHKLIIFPISVDIIEHTDRKMSQITATYKIVDVETGEQEQLQTCGNGSDPQDKGSGKAWTYAYKALLQKTFMLFSGEDTDNTHSEEIFEKEISESELKSYFKEKGYDINNFKDWVKTQKEKGRTNNDMKKILLERSK